MIVTKHTRGIYFIGIGGIGMSSLARYFRAGGYDISGYDRYESSLTLSLSGEGCNISYMDDPAKLPALYHDPDSRDKVLVVYTPAIPKENNILRYFRANNYKVVKRSEVLGAISASTETLAIAGTHGKTTISTMLAHMLKQSSIGCSAFLGGISKNYNTNMLLGNSRYTVIEADEFDRSFHRLSPFMAAISSLDPDHLDIYGDHITMIDAYNEFCGRIRKGGKLVIKNSIQDMIPVPEGVSRFTYGFSENSDFRYLNIRKSDDCYSFDLVTPDHYINDLEFPFPGIINIENATAASCLALLCGISIEELRKALGTFRGVVRRFDIRLNSPGHVYIDDYAHHPEEIRAFISSVKEYFTGRKITAIFQPHLYSRTRDHADGFAKVLDTVDDIILLPVYPAREKPVKGVTSSMIYEKMHNSNKRLLEMKDIPSEIDLADTDILLTIGAGDIDRLVEPIERAITKMTGNIKRSEDHT